VKSRHTARRKLAGKAGKVKGRQGKAGRHTCKCRQGMKKTKAGRQNRQGGKGRPTTKPTKAVHEAKACRQAAGKEMWTGKRT
jgi:hypothetical protein